MRFAVRARAVAALAVVAVSVSACNEFSFSVQHPSGTVASSSAPTATASKSASAPSPKLRPTSHTPSPAELRTQAAAAVRTIIKQQAAGGVSVAALNMSTGKQFSAGATSGMWTASCYKLLVLISLILAQGGIGGYSATAQRAIENSDNVAGYSLYTAAGGSGALVSALRRLGATHTVPGASDPTFTRTSATDYLKALKALVTPGILSASQRSTILGLMRNVESDQRWGVGVVADKGTDFANKNGWLSIDNNGPGESDNGLWAVNSAGIVRIGGQQVLMAVFTQHQSDFATGIRLVQKLARTVAPAVAPPR